VLGLRHGRAVDFVSFGGGVLSFYLVHQAAIYERVVRLSAGAKSQRGHKGKRGKDPIRRAEPARIVYPGNSLGTYFRVLFW